MAERFKVRTGEEDQAVDVPLNAAPLLRFNDPARELRDASQWARGEKGRPVCLLAMEQYAGGWWFELISLSSDQLAAEAEPLKWTPPAGGLQMQPFPDAARPAKDAFKRLPQMKPD
jgi:hypothetical protein